MKYLGVVILSLGIIGCQSGKQLERQERDAASQYQAIAPQKPAEPTVDITGALPTEKEFYNCSAIVAYAEYRKEDPSGAYESFIIDFDSLMNFQKGYESSALGHETVMYDWKQKGKRLCMELAAQGRHPIFPSRPTGGSK